MHTIEVTFDTADYEAAMAEFAETGDKDFIRADVVIDGTLVQDVGLRLKGNSTLFGRGRGPAARGVAGGWRAPRAPPARRTCPG